MRLYFRTASSVKSVRLHFTTACDQRLLAVSGYIGLFCLVRPITVLSALGQAASELRGKLGESLASIQKFDTSLQQATTSPLDALKAYSLGLKTRGEKGDVAGISYFRRAIELDPNFAMAHAHIATAYGNLGEFAAQFQRILDNRGITLNSPIGSLAHLGLGRALAAAGDREEARTAYQDFFALWKDADPDIPILIAAKTEYAKLK